MEFSKKQKSLFLLSATSLAVAVGFSTFIIVDENMATASLIQDNNSKAVCYNKNTGLNYFSLNKALEQVKPNEEIYVYPNQTLTIESNLIIPEGTSLILPFEGETYSLSVSDVSTSNNRDTSDSEITTYRKTLLNLRNGADIYVEPGANLYIGGEFFTRGNSGKYTEINLGPSSSIECEGNLFCYGYIKEDFETFISSNSNDSGDKFSNANDYDRYVSIKEGGYLEYPLAIYDGLSGGRLKALLDAGVCPITAFNFPMIQTYCSFDYGSKVTALARVSAISMSIEQKVEIISTSDANEISIFKMNENSSIDIEYIPLNPKFTKPGLGSNVTQNNYDYSKIFFDGDIDINRLYFSITGVGEIDTSKMFLPISYNFHLYVNQESNINVLYDVKFLPGSFLYLDINSKLNINKNLAFYKNDSLSIVTTDDGVVYPNNMGDARFINNGNIILNEGSNIGGLIEHNNEGNDIKSTIDASASTNETFSVSSPEGTSLKEVILPGTVYTYNESSQELEEKQFEGQQVIYSAYRSPDLYYWEGRFTSAYDLNIFVNDSYQYNIYDYTVYLADDSNGANERAISSTITGPNATNLALSIEEGSYLRIDINREERATLNSSIEIDSSAYYYVDKDFNVEISPSEGVQVKIATSGNSGAGHVEYKVYESNTNIIDNSWMLVGETSTGSLTTYVTKGYYFYFTTHSSYGYHFTDKIYYIDGVQTGTHGNNINLCNDVVYEATGNYSFEFGWNFCFEKGTLITTNRGLIKVEDLQKDDLILSYNHFVGRFEYQPINIVINHGLSVCQVMNLYFDDGSKITFIGEHGLFNLSRNQYSSFTIDNYEQFIGEKFVKVEDGVIKPITLTYVTVDRKITESYTCLSRYNLNCITNDLLSISSDLHGLYNIFKYNDNLMYDPLDVKESIEKYGLFEASEFKDVLEEKYFDYYNVKYLKISIGKGLMTYQDIMRYIEEELYGLINSGEAPIH